MNLSDLQRREFITSLATLSAAAVLQGETSNGVIYRNLGSTGERVSAIGLGGYHIGVPSEDEGIRIIRTALDRGITFLDNSWDYHDGGSEVRMGKALRDGYRKRAFLMTKYNGRTRASAAQQIDDSLRRLQTDHIDLIQFHENIRMTDADKYFAPGGAHEAVMAAKKAGKETKDTAVILLWCGGGPSHGPGEEDGSVDDRQQDFGTRAVRSAWQ